MRRDKKISSEFINKIEKENKAMRIANKGTNKGNSIMIRLKKLVNKRNQESYSPEDKPKESFDKPKETFKKPDTELKLLKELEQILETEKDYEKRHEARIEYINKAFKYGFQSIVDKLVNIGDDIPQIIELICKDDNVNGLKMLSKAGIDVETKNEMLLKASQYNAIEVVGSLIISDGVNINFSNPDEPEKTALFYAVKNNNEAMVDLLINANAKLEKRESINQDTELHVACKNGDFNIASKLILAGADVNAQNRFYRTPLQFACMNNRSDMVKMLIENGADVNIKGRKNDTALHIAVENNNLELTSLLIESGADIYAKKANGKTPMYIAKQNGATKIQNLLEAKQKETDKGYTL